MITIINKAISVTQHSARTTDNIHTNLVLNTKTETGIIKTDISDHFSLFLMQIDLGGDKTSLNWVFSEIAKGKFKQKLHEVNWDYFKTFENTNESYNKFLEKFILLYSQSLLRVTIKLFTPLITKGTQKISHRKQ